MAKYQVGDKVYLDEVGILAELAVVKAVYPKKRFFRQKYIVQQLDTGALYQVVTEDKLLPRV